MIFFNQPAKAMPSDLGSEAASTDPSMCQQHNLRGPLNWNSLIPTRLDD